METSLTERLESLKAGLLGALATGFAFAGLMLATSWLRSLPFVLFADLPSSTILVNLILSTGIAVLSGFLFGATYRYIIRQDNNPHLKSGAVLAFGLVRGLAQVEVGLNLWKTLLPFIVLTVESILLFVIARFFLDWALAKGWLQTFKSS
ncbi:hypothetical protein [Leptothermofonsia sp. ETS-13]|uniref:hypothetical protein n=1 Tax=Leptothermofonsia sp. ETS-13 TaxID=3035696 RepID=UPI003B9DFA0A